MKKYINKFKLYLHENLRISSKIEFTRPSNIPRRRTFQDIDISKDFEKRLGLQTKKELIDKRLQIKKRFDLMTLEELEAYRKNKKRKEELELSSDLNQKIIVDELKYQFTLIQ